MDTTKEKIESLPDSAAQTTDMATMQSYDFKPIEITAIDYDAINASLPAISATDISSHSFDLSSITALTQGISGTIQISGSGANVLGGNINPNTVWTTTGTGYAWNTPMQVDQGGKIALQGDKADVEINGKSLKSWMERVEERLNMLTPNPELEKDWDDLRRLGDRYRKLEQKCKQKANMWEKLKSMPPPTVP